MAARATLLLLLGVCACTQYPKTPEEALMKIERVVAANDCMAAWDLVDSDTRKSADSVLQDERLMQTIVKAKYPPAEAARELEKLAGADEPDAQHFFARTTKAWQQIEAMRKRLGAVSGPTTKRGDGPGSLWITRNDGMPFHLIKVGGGYAWADLRGEWQLERDRAAHAVKTVRDNAALYQKADTP